MEATRLFLLEPEWDKALMPNHDRQGLNVASGFLSAGESDVGFLYSSWAQPALPHRRLPDDQIWQVGTDQATLLVQPGARPGNPPVQIGVPYGSRARLILIFLQSEAQRTDSREIELGQSLKGWLLRLGISQDGRSTKDVRDQAERISRCRISFQIVQGDKSELVNHSIMDMTTSTGKFSESNEQDFLQKIVLSEVFFEQLKRYPIPVKEDAISKVASSSFALDVYCWLAYQLHTIAGPTSITWKKLRAQFAQNLTLADEPSQHLKHALKLASSAYPAAQVEVGERVVTLKPSPVSVAAKETQMVTVPGQAYKLPYPASEDKLPLHNEVLSMKNPVGTPPRNFGDLVAKYRIEARLTQVELAKLCGINQANISRIEKGVWEPKLSTIQILAKYLEMPIGDLNFVFKK